MTELIIAFFLFLFGSVLTGHNLDIIHITTPAHSQMVVGHERGE